MGGERRVAERRQASVAVATERRAPGRDHRRAVRRVLGERRRAADRRQGESLRRGLHAAPPAGPLSNRDRERARALPAEFAAATGTPVLRITKLIRRHWASYPVPARAELAESLLPLLEPLAGSGTITHELRTACEATIQAWLENTRSRMR